MKITCKEYILISMLRHHRNALPKLKHHWLMYTTLAQESGFVSQSLCRDMGCTKWLDVPYSTKHTLQPPDSYTQRDHATYVS
jgi:hypothetical protein